VARAGVAGAGVGVAAGVGGDAGAAPVRRQVVRLAPIVGAGAGAAGAAGSGEGSGVGAAPKAAKRPTRKAKSSAVK
jgi:hypothetical protein